MQKPSDQWKKLRRAALERARRSIVEPLNTLYMGLLAASAVYLIGFLRLTFAGQPDGFTLISGAAILTFGLSGLLLPILTGSVITLQFAERRFAKLIEE
ncbi:hypothetical protein [uncultured Roseobacter sp.]|uniref:hypothetical protein n=1 Tax=uncultured Roseobacter sp. TaxID=114847 RepID=UPI002622A9A0|nr:hypothetical protein [uncultured Roseobacter sp.]